MRDNDRNLVDPRADPPRSTDDEEEQIPERAEPSPVTPDQDRLPDGNYVGEDNIRQGRVGGVMGGPHQQGGEGQGG